MTHPLSSSSEVRAPAALPDSVPRHWSGWLMPAAARPYLHLARIDRPIGWWLLLLPCWWSAALAGIAAGRPGPDLWHCLLFWIGAVAMRGAGSTYNDIVDRDLDRQVERTRGRPLASGAISVAAAVLFLLAQALVGLLVLLQFNRYAVAVGAGSLAIVALYPFMKRVMSLPQLVLGLAFAWGGLMGWAAARAELAWPALAIYAAAVAWTIGYDTVYALQDARDDAIVGIRSSARLFGGRVRSGVALCYAAAVLLAAAAIAGAGGGLMAWIGLAACAAHLSWQVGQVRPGLASATALMLFRSNRTAGLLLFAGLSADGVLRFG